MKVGEIMTRKVVTLKPQASAKEAVELLFKRKISGLPVVDDDNVVKGMFTEKDIMSYLLPGYLQTVGKFIYEEHPKGIAKKVQELANIKVGDIMRKEVVTVLEDTLLVEVSRIMLTQKIRRVIVVDKDNRLLGMVSRGDVLKRFLEGA
ncbi:MAG: CBS domain-containing protein [Candidatus Omnitrophica bacterium]|nr:CBS domain-containing protein [Candidatus Omnitrophota bacterium]